MSGTYIDATPPVIGPATDLDQACEARVLNFTHVASHMDLQGCLANIAG